MATLHIFLLPINFYGHFTPALDMAKLLISRGVNTTIISTPSLTQRIRDHGFPEIPVHCVEFPEEFSGADDTNTPGESTLFRYRRAISTLQEPVEKLLEEFRPHCLIADMFYPWASEAAAKFNIPRLAFNGTSLFSMCASDSIRRHKPFRNVSSDTEPFLLPDLPNQVAFTRIQLSPNDLGEIRNEFDVWVEKSEESMMKGYGFVFNSFYELEGDYADHYKKFLGWRAWTIGPLFLINQETKDVPRRSVHEDECSEWLESKKPNSVVYICFGTITRFTDVQLHEIAKGLEASGQEFIWVVPKGSSDQDDEKWLPEGFEERTKDKGLIIRGWAPQRMILSHKAVGAFVTHCGWNSTLEAVCAGVPMVTWPLFAEQFPNGKLVTDVLKVGVSIGNLKFLNADMSGGLLVKREAIVESLRRVMVGEEAMEIRDRVKALKEKAIKAVEPGGSSHSDLSSLLEELRTYHNSS